MTDARVLFSNIIVGGVGIDLSYAKNVVILEPQWNPFSEKQAIGRLVRTGQTDAVRIFKLIGVYRLELAGVDCFVQVDRRNTVSLIKTGVGTVDEAVVMKQYHKVCEWCMTLGHTHRDALNSYMEPNVIAATVRTIVM